MLAVAASAGGCLLHMMARCAFRGEREKRKAARAGRSGEVMKRLHNPLPVRLWHWANALCILVLILTASRSATSAKST